MKKRFILYILTIFFIGIPFVNASTNTYERTEENNYGVNKHWNINSSNISNVKSTPYVDASEKIYDYADILTDEEEKHIYDLVNEFITKTNMDMVILTIDKAYYSDSQNEICAADFYDYNDFGIDFENYSGVLLLRNAYVSDPYYNVYMFGNAQLYYDWDRSESMLDAIYYDFSHHDYVPGYETFISMYTNYFNSGIPSSNEGYFINEDGEFVKKYAMPIVPAFLIAAIITAITMGILISKNKMVKVATKAADYVDKNSVNITTKEDRFVNSHTTSYKMSSSSSGGGGGGSSSSVGSSGGSHSSGGGRHG